MKCCSNRGPGSMRARHRGLAEVMRSTNRSHPATKGIWLVDVLAFRLWAATKEKKMPKMVKFKIWTIEFRVLGFTVRDTGSLSGFGHGVWTIDSNRDWCSSANMFGLILVEASRLEASYVWFLVTCQIWHVEQSWRQKLAGCVGMHRYRGANSCTASWKNRQRQ